MSATGGAKGEKDSQLAWAPPLALIELGKVYGFGAKKYDPSNYRKGYEWSKSFNAMMRHALSFWSGEDTDPESGLPHMAHAAWHCLALIEFMQNHRNFDDRFIGTKDLEAATYTAIEEVADMQRILADANRYVDLEQQAWDRYVHETTGYHESRHDQWARGDDEPEVPHHIEHARDIIHEEDTPEAAHLSARRDMPA